METKLWKEQLLVPGSRIYFQWASKEYGRAEFSVCPVYKYGKLVDMYIYPRQQKDVDTYYHAHFNNPPYDFSFSSYDNLTEPRIWIHGWCKEHKCNFFRLYVPDYSKYFEIHWLSNFGVYFRRY